MFNLSKHAQGILDGALDGLAQATDDASALVDPNEQTNLSPEDLDQGLTEDQAGAAFDAARVAKWNKIVSQIGDMPADVMNAIERMPEFQTWQPRIENASTAASETLVEEGIQGAEMPIMGTEDFDPTEQIILSRANELRKNIEDRQYQQQIWNQQSRAAFNLIRHKKAQMPMPQAMPQAMPQEETGRFPVGNEGDFISKFADDLLAFNNRPGTQEYEQARMAAEEIRDAVSPGFEEEANSILESVMQLDITQRDVASNHLMKLYEVLVPPMFKGDQAESQMEPVMSEKKQDAVEGIVRFSLTDSVLNNKQDMTKTAADQFGQQYMLYGPTEKRICPKLRGKNLSVGDVVSEYTCRMHCIDGIVIDDNKTICGEALWRANAMDKFSREYVNEDGDIVGGYINKRFEVNRNVPEENKMRLKPGETRKPRPAAWGNTESRLQDMRSKEGQARDYRPETNTGNPFEWCHDVDQNNVGVSQAERDRREEAAGHKLVQYTNRDQAENNPKKAFNLKQFKTAQSPVHYKPMDTHQTTIGPASNRAIELGVSQPPNVEPTQGFDKGKPMAAPMASEDTESDVISQMAQQGLILIKEHQPWGRTLEFKDDAGKVVYYDHGKVLTASQMADELEKNWQPPTSELENQKLQVLRQLRELGGQVAPDPGLPTMIGFNLKQHKEAMSSADIRDSGVKDTHVKALLDRKHKAGNPVGMPMPEKMAECPHPHTTALPDHDYFRQNQPQDGHNPDVKPKKKT